MRSEFEVSFEALTGFTPLTWQWRLFQWMIQGNIPPACDLPTGLGKTSVIAIWLLARAFQEKLPRRLVYVVDRRVVVDQATKEAEKLRRALQEQTDLSAIRGRLGLGNSPLPVSTLRGSLADNREWLSEPEKPSVIVGTIDMIGSRLLFQGYGVSRGMRPYQAGLLGADTLFVLDEAHLCPPFEALMRAVATDKSLRPSLDAYRGVIPRFHFLPLSATGRTTHSGAFQLEAEDRDDDLVQKRLGAVKRLKAKRLEPEADLIEELAERAWNLRGADNRVLVYCNRRKDAEKVGKAILDRAKREKSRIIDPELLVGTRRVRERKELVAWLENYGFMAGSKVKRETPVFLVATSAGEVGIDLDADHLVCDLVPFERMVQRFGRVNRRGEGAATIDVLAVAPKAPKGDAKADQKEKYRHEKAVFEAGLSILDALPSGDDGRHDASPGAIVALKERAADDAIIADWIRTATTPEPLRPAQSRALVDAWSMTSLGTHSGRPEVGPWLRGWINEEPQTAVAWRRLLPQRRGQVLDAKKVKAFFDAAPVHLTEILEASTSEVVETLVTRAAAVLKPVEPDENGQIPHEDDPAVFVLDGAGEFDPYRSSVGEFKNYWTIGRLAKLVEKTAKREKDTLFSSLIGKQVVVSRLLGGLSDYGLLDPKVGKLPQTLDDGWTMEEVESVGYQIFKNGAAPTGEWRTILTLDLSDDDSDDSDTHHVSVMTLRSKTAPRQGDPAVSRNSQILSSHHDWTGFAAGDIADAFRLPDRYREMLIIAGHLHDSGKQRPFWQQAMKAPAEKGPYAKTTGNGNVRLLGWYRHEFGSLGDVENRAEFQEELRKVPEECRDLALHLIASHHGYARPVIAPIDPVMPPSLLAKRAEVAALRFARLQQQWGPWGLAWWEALFRAADWRASRRLDLQTDAEVK